MQIGPARGEDVAALLDLWGETARFHARVDPAFTPSERWRDAYGHYLYSLIDRDDARVMVARADDDIASFGIGRITILPGFFQERRRGYIQDVYTRPQWRRQGIGRRLVEEILEWFRHEAIGTVELTVASRNEDALAFWEALGFEMYMHHYKQSL